MIDTLKIINFKSIGKLELKFKKLNILCGENASGKTSIIHSILLCTQKVKDDKDIDGSIIKIGDYQELKNKNNDNEIVIEMNQGKHKRKIIYRKNTDVNLNQKDILMVQNTSEDIFEFEKSVFYLSSNRKGVVDTYQKGNYEFGTDGAEAISFLDKHQEDYMSEGYMKILNKFIKDSVVKENRKFIEHVRFWMEYITEENISLTAIEKTNQYVLSYGINKTRPINTGSGYSFLLPIVIICLGSILFGKEESTVIIENPEIYLHPEAQEKLMYFLNFCKNFIQIILETHSEHIIKSSIKKDKINTRMYVVRKINNYTRCSRFDGKEFKTNSYLEVIYRAFGIILPEFHILLYGIAQEQYNKSNHLFESKLKEFDIYLEGLDNIPVKKWKHENRDRSGKVTGTTEYNTLPTFIRNKIDHPEAKNPDNAKKYSYSDKELKSSVEFLLSILK